MGTKIQIGCGRPIRKPSLVSGAFGTRNWQLVNLRNERRDQSKRLRLWLLDVYSQIFRSYVFGPSGFWTMAPLRYAAPTPSTPAQSKERKGSNFAIWQPWCKSQMHRRKVHRSEAFALIAPLISQIDKLAVACSECLTN